MQFHKHVLKNGLRVVTVPMHDAATVTVLVMVEAGSKYETKKENGISHFLEHMCFKGTHARPEPSVISEELDSIGAAYNAFTSQEYTGYYAKGKAQNFPQLFDIITDLYVDPLLPAEEIEKEKGVICDEINMYEDTPMRHIHDMVMEALYGDQPAGWNIAGTKTLVRSFNRDMFVKYRTKHYVPSATILVVAGKVNEKDVLKAAEERFGKLKKVPRVVVKKTTDKKKGVKAHVQYKETDQTHFVLAMPSYDMYDKRNRALSIITTILGGGMSSRLFKRIRDKMGVGYYVRSYTDTYIDHGYAAVSAGVDNKRIHEVIAAVKEELLALRDKPIAKEEIEKAKEMLVSHLYMDLESSDSFAMYYGGQEVMRKKLKLPEEVEKELRAVTAKQIADVAREVIKDDRLTLALIGPFKNAKEFEKLLTFKK